MSQSIVNKLLGCAAGLFRKIDEFLQNPETLSVEFRDRVIAEFTEFDRQAFSMQLGMHAIEHAQYAIAALIDEVVMNFEWPGRTEWMLKPLQLQFFGEHLAGYGFFQRLTQLRQSGTQNVDVLEIYYICLQLGFEGKYRLRGTEHLVALQTGLLSQIQSFRGNLHAGLYIEDLSLQQQTKKKKYEISFLMINSMAGLLLVVIWLIFSFSMDYQVRTISEILRAQIKTLTHWSLSQ